MLEAGFRHIFVGIETIQEESLKLSKKTQNERRNLMDNVIGLQRSGFIITGGFIVGFDTDNKNTFKNQAKFIQESGIVISIVNLLKAPIGTALYERIRKEGSLLPEFDFDENLTNIIPIIDARMLLEGYRDILDGIYSPRMVYERSLRFFEIYKGASVKNPIHRPLKIKYLMVAVRVFFFLGIKDRNRKYFFKLLLTALIKYPKRLDFALLFSALLYQFSQMHEKYINEEHNLKKALIQ